MQITVDLNRTFQTMSGFGMSGAWWAQDVGKWTSVCPDGVLSKDRIAELLFSKTKGIGLSVYRYNLGAGSAQSGKGSYGDPLRRAESFYTPRGLDFSKDAPAVCMMEKAVEYGADELVFFVNSPIEELTVNHLGHTDKNRTLRTNIKKENIPAFAEYCLDAAEHFVKEGLPVKYISPINEPLWVWNGGQEGCHYSPRQCRRVLEIFAKELKKRPALKDVKLSGLENGDIRWFNKSYTRALLGSGEVRELVDSVNVHSYFLKGDLPFFGNRPAYLKRFRKWMDRHYPGVPVKVSEWCHMQGGKNKNMDSALVQARVMLEDITLLGASSFQGWIACSPYDYCDGLIYIDPENESFELTKRYFAFGNFSKFIPGGALRVASCADDSSVLTASFKAGDKLITVLVNPNGEEKELTPGSDAEVFVTDKERDLEKSGVKAGETFHITPFSVNTLLINLEKNNSIC
ncbi:MAG: xylanase [Clostridia bacterium]|nr:xylanase [Clostridia bacterium]